MSRVFFGASLVALLAPCAGAQFPRLAPPPPCRATVNGSAPAYLGYWSASRDARPKVAVFALQADVDDASRVYLAAALPERIRERLSLAPRLRVASEGSVSRAMTDARARTDSAAVLLRADYVITGRLLLLGDHQEVEMVLQRPGQAAPVWQASFRATTSFRAVEEAIVRGLSRALGLPSTPGMPKGWPVTDAAHAAILAGDAYIRASTRAAADSAIAFYEQALAEEPGSTIAAARLARASVTYAGTWGRDPRLSRCGGPTSRERSRWSRAGR